MATQQTPSNTERIATLESQVADLNALVTVLIERIEKLEQAPAPKVTHTTRNIENRNLDVEEVRTIFRMHIVDGLSGYKISKVLGKNAPYIYNILNRKIYADVNISDIVATPTAAAPVVETPATETEVNDHDAALRESQETASS